MKKYIFSILMAAVAAFTFNSCADVPEPYTQPQKPDDSSSTTTGTPSGTGTAAAPYNCAAAIQYCQALGSGVESTADVYVKGTVQSIESQYSADYGNVSVTLVDADGNTTFKIWRAYYFNNKKWTTGGKEVKVGDELVFCGKVINYSGNTPETVQSKAWLVSINGESDSSTTPDTPTTGKGSESDPYTVAEAIDVIKAGAPSTEVYLTGIISEVTSYSDTYKSITYYISDDGKSKDMQVYSGKGLNGADFSSKDDLKAGQKVTIKGIIKAYTNKSGTTIMEVDKTSSIIKIEDGSSTTPDTPATGGNEMSASDVSVNNLTTKTYGSQSTTDESTWYTWTYNSIAYKGAKICISDGTQGQGIQMQGNASDAAKQGFLFNSTAFSKEIKTITICLSTKASSTFAPSYSLYAANTANGRDTKVEGTSTNETSGDWKTYTEVYDMSSYNTKYFTLWNNTQGALYIKKIIITLK